MTTTTRTGQPPGADPHGGLRPTRYGAFSGDGSEYRITDPRTPRPWVNVIANPRMGLVVSQSGSGFTWIDNSQLAVVTRWQQDLTQDSSGKFLYLRDADSGAVWSLSPAPVWAPYQRFECRHGLGYTTFESETDGIASRWTLFVHSVETVELWRVELSNLTNRPRRLEISSYLEWNCGVAPSPRREFTKLFLENEFDPSRRAVFARNHMWEVPSQRYAHWNTDFPYFAAFACTEPISAAQGDKTAFVGRYRDLRSPQAVGEEAWTPEFGRHGDPIAALRSHVVLAPGANHIFGYALAVASSRREVETLLERTARMEAIERSLDESRAAWRVRLAAHRVRTPDPTVDLLANDWLRYQAIGSRLWGRCGYYQQSGAYGFRDQLQDSQVWLTIEPSLCREQILLHTAHQFTDGSVYHWWHPLSEQGHVTQMSDDLLWLPFVTASYVRETGALDILADPAPYLDDPEPWPLSDHVLRAFRRALGRTSARGLPYIGAGDWNDGLSAVGLAERGESVWLAHFLAGLLAEWAQIWRRAGREDLASEFAARRDALVTAVNAHAWDGEWYVRATLDDGSLLGSAQNRVARIFLNAQTWAVLAGVAPPERAARCMAAVREHLLTEAGPLLLAPAFDAPNPAIGYITRYAPGLRENGGVYTHAATWAIAAACKMRDHDMVGRLLSAINPASKDPDRYWAEPYVLPGNVDGPASPHHGRGGWTWYTGAAAWLHRVIAEWVLGVRPEWEGLRIDPCLPLDWNHAEMTRPFRDHQYRIVIERSDALHDHEGAQVMLDGATLASNLVPPPAGPAALHEVRVRCR
jgi:cellobiose phosphorylase